MSLPSQQQLAEHIIAQFNAQRHQEVLSLAQSFVERFPNHSFGWKVLGGVLKLQGRIEEALPNALRATQINPRDFESQQNLAIIYKELSRFEEAEQSFLRALAIKRTPLLLSSLGVVRAELGRWAEAEANHREALALEPDHPDILLNLATTMSGIGHVEYAGTLFQRVVDANPKHWMAWDGLLFNPSYAASRSREARRALADAYGARLETHIGTAAYTSWLHLREPKTLRVGLVSADFGEHPVGYFLQSVLPEIDRAKIEIYAYTNRRNVDSVTRSLSRTVSQWIEVTMMKDDALARRIRDDGVHLLIDLSGHTLGNRLPMFALKPVPVSASWLGYFATTGLTAIDYLIADELGVPAEHDSQFSERVWRLPRTRLCFSAPSKAGEVGALPALANGFFTIGCFQNYAKITDEVLVAWSRVLAQITNARLRVQTSALCDETVCAAFIERLRRHRIDPARVTLLPATNRSAYLAAHREIDLILDTFPFPGGTTTCEALWMGVPTLTLMGDTLISRQGACLLAAVGLDDWIANDVENYVEKAVSFLSDSVALARLRTTLRETVAASALFDAKAFARDLEAALWGMWQQTGAPRLRAAT
jgi:protein O-GlcNAc transferase